VRLDGVMDISVRVNHLNGLYEQGAINDEEYGNRAAALHVASEIIECATQGKHVRLEEIFQENPNLDVNAITENEASLLYLATGSVMRGKSNCQVLEVLLKNRSQVDKRKNGLSPLLQVCEKSNFSNAHNVAKVLTTYGADVKATSTIQGRQTSFSCLVGAIESNGSSALIEVLCKAGANPNDTLDPHGPLLNYCIIEGLLDQAMVLLDYGANPNTSEVAQGATCLASAITNGHVEIVKKLLSKGANTNAAIMRNQQLSAKELAKYVASKDSSSNAQEIARLLQ